MGSKSGSNLNRKICILMLTASTHPVSGMELRAALGLSKSLFSYHIKQLCTEGITKETFSDGCKFYDMTEQGRVQILSAGVTPPLTALHNIGFKFKILKQPAQVFGKPVSLANWTKFQLWFKDAYVYRTPTYLVVRPIPEGDRLPGTNPFKLRELALAKAINIAQELAQKYDMVLGQPEDEAKGEYATKDIVAEHTECKIKTPDAIIDHSLGDGEIDFRNPEAAMEYLRLPKKVADLENGFNKMVELVLLQNTHQEGMAKDIHYIAENYKAHVGVVVRLNKLLSQKSLTAFIKQPISI